MPDAVKSAGAEYLPERDYECPRHGRYRESPVKIGFAVFTPPCPLCAAEESALQAEEYRKRREREDAEAREKRLAALNIGKRLWDESFETFDAYTPELKRHREVCAAFARNSRGRKLVMLGKNGTGKNHLAASILKITGGCVYTVFEIELLLRRAYSGEVREGDVYARLCETPVLVIDEIGRHKTGAWEMNFLSYVINKRHENLMPAVFISNKHLGEDCRRGAAGCPDCLDNFLGSDVLSRIIEDGEIMYFTGEDYRYKRRLTGRKINGT